MTTMQRRKIGVKPFGPTMFGQTAREQVPPFCNEFVELSGVAVSMDSWESKSERGFYRSRAERMLNFYRHDVEELRQAQTELKCWQELKWEEVFHPTDGLRGVSCEKERVQTSNISNEPHQIFAAAESMLERNQRERENIEQTIDTCQKRLDTELSLLDLMQGNTREVARHLWFDETAETWRSIADKLDISERTVGNERNRAIEIVALFLKRSDYRLVRTWFM